MSETDAANTVVVDPRSNFEGTYMDRANRIVTRFIKSAVLIDDDWPSLPEQSMLYRIPPNQSNGLAVVSSGSDNSQSFETEEIELEAEEPDAVSNDNHNASSFPSFLPHSERTDVSSNILRLLKIQEDFVQRGVLFTGFKYTAKSSGRAPNLAKNADIVILDWNFAGDSGAGAMQILSRLKSDGHLRFICIFTDQPDLISIKSLIYSKVFGRDCGLDASLSFDIDNFVITLRNKDVNSKETTAVAVSTVESLFNDAIASIAALYNGYLQLSVLEMSSRHRSTLMSHLRRFSRDFDAAILSEVSQEHSPVDMGAGLRAMLIDEWRVALEAASSNDDKWMLTGGRTLYAQSLKPKLQTMTQQFVIDCCIAAGVPAKTIPAINTLFEIEEFNGKRCSRFDYEVEMWLNDGAKQNLSLGGIAKKYHSRVTLAVLYALSHSDKVGNKPTAAEVYKNLLQLDALFNQQTTLPAEVMQGTILKYDSDSYFICVTPLCDTARLPPGYHPYTFLEGTRAGPEAILEHSPDYCVFTEAGMPVCLHIDIKRPHVFELDHHGRRIDSDQKVLRVRYRQLRVKSEGSVVGQGAAVDTAKPGSQVLRGVQTVSDGIADAEIEEEKLQDDGVSFSLKVVGQLRTDFFLMFTAASASNSSRVGVNRVELIRKVKTARD